MMHKIVKIRIQTPCLTCTIEMAYLDKPIVPITLGNRFTELTTPCTPVSAAKLLPAHTSISNVNRLQQQYITLKKCSNLAHQGIARQEQATMTFVKHRGILYRQTQMKGTIKLQTVVPTEFQQNVSQTTFDTMKKGQVTL